MLPSVLERLFRAAERRPWTVSAGLIIPGWVTVVRVLLERELSLGPAAVGRPAFPWLAQTFVFYVALHVTLTALLARATRGDWRQAAGPVGMGLTLGTLPPLIDVAISGPGRFAYEYAPRLDAVPWGLYLPPRVLPVGETLVLWTTVVLMGLAGLRAGLGVARAAALSAATWGLVLLYLVLLPAAAAALYRQTGVSQAEWLSALFSLATFGAAVVATGTAARLARRALHVTLAPVFLLLGAAWRGPVGPPVGLLAVYLALLSAGFALANDWHDRAEDAAAGRGPPLSESAAALLTLVPLVACGPVVGLRLQAGLALLGFAAVSHAYHADPLRLKCTFPLSYKTEGFLGGLAFYAGLTAAPAGFLAPRDLWAALAVTLGTPVALLFKDQKDVAGDRSAGVRTAFVVLAERGWREGQVRALSIAGLLVSLSTVTVAVAFRAGAAPGAVALLSAAALAAAGAAWRASTPARAVAWGMGWAQVHLLLAAAVLRGG